MKFSGFWFLLLFVGTSTLIFSIPVSLIYGLSTADILPAKYGDNEAIVSTSRKLKESGHSTRRIVMSDAGHEALDDYHPINPVPSSKASIKPGPIEHGTPLVPFIPRPPPPSHPETGGST